MKKRITGAIFDMDGTLIDSMEMWDNVGQTYLRHIGVEPRDDLREILRPMSLRQSVEYMNAAYGLKREPEQMMAEIDRLIERRYYTDIPLKPGVSALLDDLRARAVPMCVATATDRYLVEACLSRLGVLDRFAFILTCNEAGSGKDTPAIFETACRRLGTDKATTWVFEDALFAMKTAKAAGFPVAAVYDQSAAAQQDEIRALCDRYILSFEADRLNF